MWGAITAQAQADVPVAWQHKAVNIAQTVWRPSCGQLAVRFGDPATVFTDPSFVHEWATPGDCTVNIDQNHEFLGFPDFCTLVLHGAGHAAGFHEEGGPDGGAHSSNPDSVMYPFGSPVRSVVRVEGSKRRFVVWDGVDQRCLTRDQAPSRNSSSARAR